MSSRRHLVQRTPAQNREETRSTPATALPPYEPPKYAMGEKYQRQLSQITATHDYDKYKKHIQMNIKSISNSTADGYERINEARIEAAKIAKRLEKSEAKGEDNIPNSQAGQQALKRVDELEKKVDALAKETEKALRELIDYGDELAHQPHMLKAIQEQVAMNAARAPDINPGTAGQLPDD